MLNVKGVNNLTQEVHFSCMGGGGVNEVLYGADTIYNF